MNVALPSGSLVITDLHLDVEALATGGGPEFALLERFVAAAAGAPGLVILGDLFEFWLGPSHVPAARPVLELLAGFPGVVHLIPGNRDVLMGAEVAPFGIHLHRSGFAAGPTEGGRTPLLCLHGDELCIHDRGYQRLRRTLRNPLVRGALRSLPRGLGRRLAERARSQSREAVAEKARGDLAQDRGEARRRLASAGAEALLVGHVHAFADERLPGGGRFAVLDAFDGNLGDLAAGAPPADLARIAWGATGVELEFGSVRGFCDGTGGLAG